MFQQALLISKEEWQLDKEAILKNINATLPLPLIVKPHDDGCSCNGTKNQKIERTCQLQ